MSKPTLLVLTLLIAISCFLIIMRNQTPLQKVKLRIFYFPWGYFVGIGIAAIFVFDFFNLNLQLLGWIIFAFLVSYKYRKL